MDIDIATFHVKSYLSIDNRGRPADRTPFKIERRIPNRSWLETDGIAVTVTDYIERRAASLFLMSFADIFHGRRTSKNIESESLVGDCQAQNAARSKERVYRHHPPDQVRDVLYHMRSNNDIEWRCVFTCLADVTLYHEIDVGQRVSRNERVVLILLDKLVR
nr:hypothetical protein [Rhodovulum sp. PH10]